MNDLTLKTYIWLRTLVVCEEAQDLVEYALLVMLIACGVTMGMKTMALGVNHAYNTIDLDFHQNIGGSHHHIDD